MGKAVAMGDARLESTFDESSSSALTLFFAAPLMGAAAGGMGWGIRGQYGHEWGAMVPGALVGFALVFLFCRRATSLRAARAIALTAVAISMGGIMTYGQTVGLTHDSELVGNLEAYRWGMVGLFVKGGLWIGFGGTFLGIGLGGKRYGWKEMLILFVALVVLGIVGIQLLNRPYVPGSDRAVPWYFFSSTESGERALPSIYFSDHWYWEPDKEGLDPRPEVWGGLLAALLGLLAYVSLIKKDKLARNMTFFGVLGGGLGFTLGQALQAKHSWTPDWLTEFDHTLHGWMPGVYPEEFFSLMGWNWWNMMETTFGLVMGFVLGFGLWLNRRLVAPGDTEDSVSIPPVVEWVLIIVYTVLLFLWGVTRYKGMEFMAALPLAMGLLPVVCIVGGRYMPYLQALPLVTLSIAGITLKFAGKDGNFFGEYYVTDTFLRFVLPMGIMTLAAYWFERRGREGQSGCTFARYGLILSTVTYFSLNFVAFGFPWGPLPAGGRHTNCWIFLRCMELLIFGALLLHRSEPRVTPLTTEKERSGA
ncbi:MAG: hypothetical protein KDA86_19880 [Planctomycetaceae bacterium]|nr:hypothetical protein [Planctomycetaceae bacterium]